MHSAVRLKKNAPFSVVNVLLPWSMLTRRGAGKELNLAISTDGTGLRAEPFRKRAGSIGSLACLRAARSLDRFEPVGTLAVRDAIKPESVVLGKGNDERKPLLRGIMREIGSIQGQMGCQYS